MSLRLSRILLPLLLAIAASFAAPVAAAQFQAGTHYSVIADEPGAEPVTMEFFSYGCGACFSFEPFVQRMKAVIGDKAEFNYIPVDFGGGFFTPTQKLFLVLEALGRREELHQQVFQFIHGERGGRVNEAAVREFAERHGISEEKFEKTLKSFAVHVKKQRYDQLTKRFQISATPTFVVNGKYRIENRALTSPDQFAQLVDYLLTNP